MIVWILAAFAAFFVKGLCGFANTLVFTSALSFTANNVSITPVELLLGYPTNLIMVWRERKNVKWGICLPLAALVLLGSIPGMFLLKNADSQAIKIAFGAVVMLVGAEMLLRELGKLRRAKQSRVVMGVIGVASGVLCGLYGVGALLAAYVSRAAGSSGEFKANICFVFAVENTFRVIVYSILGIINFAALKTAAILVPFMLIGLFLGIKSSGRLDEKKVKLLVIVLLIVSGASLILTNL